MRTIKEHFSDTLILTNSLIVKLIDVAIVMNNGIFEKYGIDPGEDLAEWKYFLNISGQRHYSNNDVFIKLLETDEIVLLTKDILSIYPYTNKELLKYGTYYKSLLEEYPSETLYIKGCMSPVDIDVAIAAVDGTILNYNKNYVEPGEYNLIRELQHYIISFLGRWNVKAYVVTDELYVPSLLAVLYGNIPNAINNIRLSKIYTNEVHSFHMEHFFASNLDIWDDIKILNNKTKYWLYKNLKYLIKHVGKDKVFKLLINLLNDNNIGVGEYILRHSDPTLYESDDLINSGITKTSTVLVTSALNKAYTIDNNTVLDLSTIIGKELLLTTDTPSTLDNVKEEHLSRVIEQQLDSSLHDNEKTKILDINILKLFDMTPVDPYLVTIDLLTKNVFNNKYNTQVDYIEPNTKSIYKLTTKSAYLMLVKQLLFMVDAHEQVIPNIVYTSIPKLSVAAFNTATDNLYKDGYVEDIFTTMLSYLPSELATINNADIFNTYLAGILSYYQTVWLLDSNVENTTTSSAIKVVFDRMLDHGTVDLRVGGVALTIDQLLANEGIVYPLESNYDVFMSIKEMLLVLTGLNLDKYETIRDTIDSIRNIINKLTSYTIQVLGNSDDTESTQINYNHLSVIRTSNGLSTVLSGEIDNTLEPLNMIKVPTANDLIDTTTVSVTSHESQLVIEQEVIRGVADVFITDDIRVNDSTPEVTVSVIPTPTYDVSNNIFVDDFIKDVIGSLYPLDDTNMTNRVGANDYIVNLTSSLINDTTPVIVGMNTVYINGTAEATVSDSANIETPDTAVVIDPEYVYDISNQTFVDDFIKGVTATIHPLDDTKLVNNVGANDYIDNSTATLYNDTTAEILAMDSNYIVGYGEMGSEETKITLPDVMVNIVNDKTYDISDETFVDDFIKGVNAVIASTTAEHELRTTSNANTLDITNTSEALAISDAYSTITLEQGITGVGENTTQDNDDIIILQDDIVVTIED